MIQAGLPGRATRHIQQALAFDDQPADTALALAEALVSEGQSKEALVAFEALLADRPDDPSALLGAARSQVLLGDLAGAEARFNRLGELGINTNRLAMERGYLAYRGGSHHEAIAFFEAGLNDPVSRGPSAAGLVWSALALGRQGKLSQGLRILETIPDYFAGQVLLHDIAKAEGNLDRAREHLLNARRLRPGDPETLDKMIRLELIEGRELEARKLLDALLAIDPGHAYGNYLLSSLHEREGRFDLAEAALQRSLRRGPMAEAYYGLAWIYERQDRLDEALAQIDRALALQPENPQFIAVKAVVLTRRESWTEASELFDRADALRTGELAAWFRLHRATVYRATGREQEAGELLAALVKEKETLSEAEANLLNTLHQ
jgi:tetratricopeptide (TPR) repeat protein